MHHYQDKETGQIYAFEDDYDPFTSDNRNIPKSLTNIVKQQPTDTSIWYQGDWIEKADAPSNYTAPISSVPSYNPAWMVNLLPYSAIVKEGQQYVNFSLDQINNNSYEGTQLARIIGTLPLGDGIGLDALISYDGTIAIPQFSTIPTRSKGIEKLNKILCSLLIGGIHTEILHSKELVIGSLHENSQLFAYSPLTLHTQLRLNHASIIDRLEPLMYPRILTLESLQSAFSQGQKCIEAIPQFSPFFLLNGYTSLINKNNTDALNNLWIIIEQLTAFLWLENYKKNKNNYPNQVQKYHSYLKREKKIDHIYAKHILLRLSKIISKRCHQVLCCARDARNDLVHRGIPPNRHVIVNLWHTLPDLLEIAAVQKNLGIRNLIIQNQEIDWKIPPKTNFEDWRELSSSLINKKVVDEL